MSARPLASEIDMNIFITGAGGYIGGSVAAALVPVALEVSW